MHVSAKTYTRLQNLPPRRRFSPSSYVHVFSFLERSENWRFQRKILLLLSLYFSLFNFSQKDTCFRHMYGWGQFFAMWFLHRIGATSFSVLNFHLPSFLHCWSHLGTITVDSFVQRRSTYIRTYKHDRFGSTKQVSARLSLKNCPLVSTNTREMDREGSFSKPIF
jgi:hypothetical protein